MANWEDVKNAFVGLMEEARRDIRQKERKRIIDALRGLPAHGRYKDGEPMFWRASDVIKVVEADRDAD